MPDTNTLNRLRALPAHLRTHLRGQDHVIAPIAALFTRGEMGLARADRPRGCFLAVGPTGTGKTEMVLLAARFLFGDASVRRFDLSEYQRSDAIERLLGESTADAGALGRAGHGTGPRVWLFDELEKAHPKVFDLFIQMLEPGRITLASGAVLSLQGDYVAFTSNLGAAEAMRMARSSQATIEQATLRRVAETLRPEILGRIPDKVVFARLTPEVQREIIALHVATETARLRAVGFDLEISREALEFLIREGFHPELGARKARQSVERFLQDAISAHVLAGNSGSGVIGVEASAHRLAIRN